LSIFFNDFIFPVVLPIDQLKNNFMATKNGESNISRSIELTNQVGKSFKHLKHFDFFFHVILVEKVAFKLAK